MSKDALGDRMKSNYESRTRYMLPRRTYTIIRLDGKAFHTFTKGLERPFDSTFVNLMDFTAHTLCQEIQGCKFGYVQSDEISLVLTDFDDVRTDAYFGGNLQKIASITASIATAHFNKFMDQTDDDRFRHKVAYFDSRVFTIPDIIEVENYFIWRQQDATKNSIQLCAQNMFSHRELHGKNTSELQDMMHSKGFNWNDLYTGYKRGRAIVRNDLGWDIDNHIPIFTKDRSYINKRLPKHLTEVPKSDIITIGG